MHEPKLEHANRRDSKPWATLPPINYSEQGRDTCFASPSWDLGFSAVYWSSRTAKMHVAYMKQLLLEEGVESESWRAFVAEVKTTERCVLEAAWVAGAWVHIGACPSAQILIRETRALR
jgi:hypothetical protein